MSISLRQTVQIGTTATIKASAVAVSSTTPLIYVWCRAASANAQCVTMPGEVGPTLTIANAGLSDDGAIYKVTVTATSDHSTQSASSQLFVSSMPPVVFSDGDFVDSEWTAASSITPAGIAATFAIGRIADGGHPGAYRKVTYDVPESGDVRVFHERVAATYDPASQGSIRAIDFSFDCLLVTRGAEPWTSVLLEQAGRRYTAFAAGGADAVGRCANDADFTPVWRPQARPSLAREDFQQLDGPPCGQRETCPDFSAGGAPLRLGMMTRAFLALAGGTLTFHYGHGIDNWKVTVWRR